MPSNSAFTRLHYYDSIDSTNSEAQRLLLSGEAVPFAISAGAQSAGRGRQGRAWQSAEGNLFYSFVCKPDAVLQIWPQLSFVAAIAVCEVLRPIMSQANLQCKWPNDVLCNDKKIAGILLETSPDRAGATNLIIGIGINISSHPDGMAYPATSIFAETRKTIGPKQLAEDLGDKLQFHIGRWQKDGFALFRQAWLDQAAFRGQKITVSEAAGAPNGQLSGIFLDLRDDGALLLGLEENKVLPIFSGIVGL